MKTIKLLMKKYSRIPLEFDNVLPELLYDKTEKEITETIIYHGNRQEQLSDYFKIEVEGECDNPSDCKIIIDGDLHRTKYIGNCMTAGTIIINSDVEVHVGAQMSGGHIIVNGNAESYAGREMTGGLLEINGNVKEFCGASYMGEWRGMSGGKIIIRGNVGKQLAECMLNGEIYVEGNCDILAGIHMAGGYIQIDGDVTQWPGGQMKKGIIVINGHVGEILQGFKKEEIIQNPLINGKYHIGKYTLYIGDIGVKKGKGQLWIKEN